MTQVTTTTLRTDLFITTALKTTPRQLERARTFAAELGAPLIPRQEKGMESLFAAYPDAHRAIIVQTERLLLVDNEGHEFFYHPNMAFLRLHNLLRGQRDLLVDAAELSPGDSVLDATLGYGAEAALCSFLVGDSGKVHGIEAIPELGLVVREGMKQVDTDQHRLNDAVRRVEVVHLGHHLAFLQQCPPGHYDVVCFDPFFGEELKGSEPFSPLKSFGEHSALLPEAVEEARRVARRRVIIKATRWSDTLERYGVRERVESRSGKVTYGILPAQKAE